MTKSIHEIRDPIHIFIRFNDAEREVLNSYPFQRLRHIHQLATSYLVYPGATHKRFEHSLGVMELATRVFDVVTAPEALESEIRELIPELKSQGKDSDIQRYWRRVLRMAALCHDLGHLPFSHAAEETLLPAGWDHERITREIILSPGMCDIWNKMKLYPEDIVKLALGPKKAKDLSFSIWETILAEIIVGDAFGVDRMDYLLRDSHHMGVAYGKFDHYRLIDTLRILKQPAAGYKMGGGVLAEDEEATPTLGVEEGGLQSAEALLLARYFMFSQVYYHHVRRAYDIHLKDFLVDWLEGGRFSTKVQDILIMTDNEVTAALRNAAFDPASRGHNPAYRIMFRGHYKLLYCPLPDEHKINSRAGAMMAKAACKEFGGKNIREDYIPPKVGPLDFPVMRLGDIVSARALSPNIGKIPSATVDYVFIEPSLRDKANRWLKLNRDKIIQPERETA
ncbi:MAG: HD domain-containing protein [bacterium]|nr:HD domain-containing protein [bacterium]